MSNLSEEELNPEEAVEGAAIDEVETQTPEELQDAELCEDELPEELELSREEELEIEVAKWKDQAVRTAA